MKKFLFFVILLIVFFVSCGGGNKNSNNDDDSDTGGAMEYTAAEQKKIVSEAFSKMAEAFKNKASDLQNSYVSSSANRKTDDSFIVMFDGKEYSLSLLDDEGYVNSGIAGSISACAMYLSNIFENENNISVGDSFITSVYTEGEIKPSFILMPIVTLKKQNDGGYTVMADMAMTLWSGEKYLKGFYRYAAECTVSKSNDGVLNVAIKNSDVVDQITDGGGTIIHLSDGICYMTDFNNAGNQSQEYAKMCGDFEASGKKLRSVIAHNFEELLVSLENVSKSELAGRSDVFDSSEDYISALEYAFSANACARLCACTNAEKQT